MGCQDTEAQSCARSQIWCVPELAAFETCLPSVCIQRLTSFIYKVPPKELQIKHLLNSSFSNVLIHPSQLLTRKIPTTLKMNIPSKSSSFYPRVPCRTSSLNAHPSYSSRRIGQRGACKESSIKGGGMKVFCQAPSPSSLKHLTRTIPGAVRTT
ncbi:hypothetical protein CEXT_442761 [Caerostris extrusa]|uniref:Uncharacterized protein n=1 Tax=Caerostris extrusa TaxID=172846 RepID=A0AAV4PH30_CAEEX|nr:hypothetical protein CEXT_442761 [Caerostris extrusa]